MTRGELRGTGEKVLFETLVEPKEGDVIGFHVANTQLRQSARFQLAKVGTWGNYR